MRQRDRRVVMGEVDEGAPPPERDGEEDRRVEVRTGGPEVLTVADDRVGEGPTGREVEGGV